MKTLETMGCDETVVEVFSNQVPQMVEFVREKVYLLENTKRDDAFFVVDLTEIHRRYQQWKDLMPRVEPFYALKCNNDPGVARFIADLGMGFDCASKREIEQILDLGVDPKKIVFANPCKPSTHIEYAVRNGVDLMMFDDAIELKKIKTHSPDARLVLRIFSSKEFKAFHNFNKKFGCHPDQAKQLLEKAKELNLNVVGVSFHVGSLPEEVACFASAVEDAYGVFEVAKQVGFDMTLLDIGGGYPGVETEPITFKMVAESLSTALDKFFPPESGIRIIAEPGRYFVSEAFTLAVNVIAKRVVDRGEEVTQETDGTLLPEDQESCGNQIEDLNDLTKINTKDDNEKKQLHMYYINDGIYGSFNNVFTDHATVFPMLLSPTNETRWSCIWGPTCDGLDSVMDECELPLMEVGQWVYFHNMGAYTVSLSCNFNGIPRPIRYFVCDDIIWNKVYGSKERIIKRSPASPFIGENVFELEKPSDQKRMKKFNDRLSLSKGVC